MNNWMISVEAEMSSRGNGVSLLRRAAVVRLANPRKTVCVDILENVTLNGAATIFTSNPKLTKKSYLTKLSALRAQMRGGKLSNPKLIEIVLASKDFKFSAHPDRIVITTKNQRGEHTENESNKDTSNLSLDTGNTKGLST